MIYEDNDLTRVCIENWSSSAVKMSSMMVKLFFWERTSYLFFFLIFVLDAHHTEPSNSLIGTSENKYFVSLFNFSFLGVPTFLLLLLLSLFSTFLTLLFQLLSFWPHLFFSSDALLSLFSIFLTLLFLFFCCSLKS